MRTILLQCGSDAEKATKRDSEDDGGGRNMIG